MRGKVNVGISGDYMINGVRKNCVVSGDDITKGDFVNVHRSYGDYFEVDNELKTYKFSQIFNINDNLKLLHYNNKLVVYDINTKEEICESDSLYSNKLSQIDNVTFVGCETRTGIKPVGGATFFKHIFHVFTYDIENSVLVETTLEKYSSTISSEYSYYFDSDGICVIHEGYLYLVVATSYSYSGNNHYQSIIFKFKMAETLDEMEFINRVFGKLNVSNRERYGYIKDYFLICCYYDDSNTFVEKYDLSNFALRTSGKIDGTNFYLGGDLDNSVFVGAYVKKLRLVTTDLSLNYTNKSDLNLISIAEYSDVELLGQTIQVIQIKKLSEKRAFITYADSKWEWYRAILTYENNQNIVISNPIKIFPYTTTATSLNGIPIQKGILYEGEYNDNLWTLLTEKINPTEDPKVYLRSYQVINNELVENDNKENMVTKATTAKYINGVANGTGKDGDSIQVICTEYAELGD